jgi:nicotinamidase/pyrazinamidase
VQGTHGAQFHPQLIRHPDIHLISKGLGDKDCYSGFDDTELAVLLREHKVTEVWVGGLATDYCVKNTVLDALRENFSVKLLTFASRAVELNPGDGVKAIEEMRQAGAEIL